jgi:hypothetical protein
MSLIDLQTALAALEGVIDDAPGGRDTVYESPRGSCVYYDEDKNAPSCGVGHALSRLGVSGEWLQTLDHTSLGGSCSAKGTSFLHTLDRAGFELTTAAQAAFGEFQACQDGGETWGVALDNARDATT